MNQVPNLSKPTIYQPSSKTALADQFRLVHSQGFSHQRIVHPMAEATGLALKEPRQQVKQTWVTE